MDTILPILKKIPLFADLSEAEDQAIIKNIILNYYPAGHIFFRESDSGETGSMYIVKRGTVKISRMDQTNPAAAQKEIATLNDNDFFGEMALVLNEARNATATAATECEVFELKKEDFLKLMQSNPTMSNKISAEFVERVKKNSK